MSQPVITTLTAAPFAYLVRTSKIADMPKTMGEGFAALFQLFAKAEARQAGMPMAHYLEYDEDSTTFELGFPVRPEDVEALRAAGLKIGETPSGENMKAVHIGPYDSIVKTYDVMTGAMEKQGLKGSRDMWEVYYSPPETPPEQIQTEVIWPLRRAA
jgi:effector-binding domain-containing protein